MVARIGSSKGGATPCAKMDQTGTSTSQFLELWTGTQRLAVTCMQYFKLGKPREREKVAVFLGT
jgi:hypothetical protein